MINYKFAKEIGATHYRECVDNEVDYYKLSDNRLTLLCYSKKCREWDESLSTGAVVLAKIKPIPSKRTRTEYEKVTESIFDLRDEFERGELYFYQGGEYLPYKLESEFAHGFMHKRIYRKIEKEIDERQEFVKEASKIWNRDDMHCSTDIFREMYDSGKFKFIG